MRYLIIILSFHFSDALNSQIRRSSTSKPVIISKSSTETSTSKSNSALGNEIDNSSSKQVKIEKTNISNNSSIFQANEIEKKKIVPNTTISQFENKKGISSPTQDRFDTTKTPPPSIPTSQMNPEVNIPQAQIDSSLDTTFKVIPNPEYEDVNAAYKAELDAHNLAIETANAKSKSAEAKIAYYKELRRKYEEDEKIRIEKEAIEAKEKAKRDAQAYDNRHLKPQEAPQFEKFRQGAKNPEVKKTTAEEDYTELFK